jgi:hypothetical protein
MGLFFFFFFFFFPRSCCLDLCGSWESAEGRPAKLYLPTNLLREAIETLWLRCDGGWVGRRMWWMACGAIEAIDPLVLASSKGGNLWLEREAVLIDQQQKIIKPRHVL